MSHKVLIVEDQFVEANYLRNMLERAGYQVCGIARSVQKAKEIIHLEKPGLVLLDIFLSGKNTGIDLAKQLREDGIAFIFLSANSNEDVLTAAKATQPYGFLVKPFREKDLLVTLEIARYRHEHSLEATAKKEKGLLAQLNLIINEKISWEQRLLKTGRSVQPHLPFEYLAAGFDMLGDISCQSLGLLRVGYDEYQTIGSKELLTITGLKFNELVELSEQTITDKTATIYNGDDFKKVARARSLKRLFADNFNLQSHLSLPLLLSNGTTFSFCLYSQRPNAYSQDHVILFNSIKKELTRMVEMMLQNGGNSGLASTNMDRESAMESNVSQVAGFDGIIGTSHLLLNVFDQITQVAPSDTSVLILGESGTGKEQIAQSIHKLSPRKSKPFVKLNCAALPSTLIESELFGHEKGAFTGAIERRTGKFELANNGTIFLDEIGEMPIELQVKLLRVLQEKEVERIGSNITLKVDVRIIAATNRNLEREVAEGRFRLDLYYRLNVFPITLPPLRERLEDLPRLAAHFINYFSRKAGKKVTGLSERTQKTMMNYDWPGNIRELEHFIERSVLLAKGPLIENAPTSVIHRKEIQQTEHSFYIKTIQENERDHIIAVLKKCNGRIWGPGAAAEMLNILPSTLKSKMKKLGIKKEYTD
ncbi:MAG: response regulator [Chitinophagaceae bacterium]|nr:MAG: response regulator [Chitinophagaceae bacterium]